MARPRLVEEGLPIGTARPRIQHGIDDGIDDHDMSDPADAHHHPFMLVSSHQPHQQQQQQQQQQGQKTKVDSSLMRAAHGILPAPKKHVSTNKRVSHYVIGGSNAASSSPPHIDTSQERNDWVHDSNSSFAMQDDLHDDDRSLAAHCSHGSSSLLRAAQGVQVVPRSPSIRRHVVATHIVIGRDGDRDHDHDHDMMAFAENDNRDHQLNMIHETLDSKAQYHQLHHRNQHQQSDWLQERQQQRDVPRGWSPAISTAVSSHAFYGGDPPWQHARTPTQHNHHVHHQHQNPHQHHVWSGTSFDAVGPYLHHRVGSNCSGNHQDHASIQHPDLTDITRFHEQHLLYQQQQQDDLSLRAHSASLSNLPLPPSRPPAPIAVHHSQKYQQRFHLEIGADTRPIERMEGVEDHGIKPPLVVLDGANLAYSYGQAAMALESDDWTASRSTTPTILKNNTKPEPNVRGITIAADYFRQAGLRVQIVLPMMWLRAKPRSNDPNHSNAKMETEQMELLQQLQQQGLLVMAPPSDDDDAYALTIAFREHQQQQILPPHPQLPPRLGYVVSNDLFRDAQQRDAGGALTRWLRGNNSIKNNHFNHGSLTDTGPGRISFAFCDTGRIDNHGERQLDFVPNPRHPLIAHIEQQPLQQLQQS